MTCQNLDGLLPYLVDLYGEVPGARAFSRLEERLEKFYTTPWLATPPVGGLSHQDALLITYPGQFLEPGVPPLVTLEKAAGKYLEGVVSGLHILPFFPSSSDDGFAVIDYTSVDPELGTWEDLNRLAPRFRLMVDAVINHVSSRSPWFRSFLAGQPPFRDYFITVPPGRDLSTVVRPRALPLLTPFQTAGGEALVWTTFSADQVDLNYHNPDVLLEIVDVLLLYLANGAQLIRLDAIAYLWKEIGTSCIHLPQTHTVVKFLRALLDRVAPQALIVTETNVPHRDNLAYFGNGHDEAHLVYNFALPPLVLHSFLQGSAARLSAWAQGAAQDLPSRQVTYLNFLASHDGIGVNPARGILSPEEIDRLVEVTQAHGGLVSLKSDPGGSASPYELNISLFDALSDPAGDEPLDRQVDRFLATQAILLSFKGIPAIYVHSLFGSRSWPEGVAQTGVKRTINRRPFDFARLEAELADPGSLPARVYGRLRAMLKARQAEPAFNPYGEQQVLDAGEAVFALLRRSPEAGRPVVCLVNVSGQPQEAPLALPGNSLGSPPWTDLLTSQPIFPSQGSIPLAPYQAAWLAGQP